jgi:hypothetical protein
MLMCYVCVFLLHREYPDMILGDKPLIYGMVLSQKLNGLLTSTYLEKKIICPLTLGVKKFMLA